MVQYGETTAGGASAITPTTAERLVRFFHILMEWDAAGLRVASAAGDDDNAHEDERDGDHGCYVCAGVLPR